MTSAPTIRPKPIGMVGSFWLVAQPMQLPLSPGQHRPPPAPFDPGRAATLQDATVDAEVPGGETRPPPNSRGTARGRLVFGHRRTG